MRTIDLVYFDAGGGHRAAALALQQIAHDQRRPWNVRLVNLVEVLDPTQRFLRWTGIRPEDVYNRQLALGWTIGMSLELRALQALIRVSHRAIVGRLERHWQVTQPDLVVSLIPNFNRSLHAALAAARPGTPFVTVLTDMADHPPRFWIEPGQDQHLVCGTERALDQARRAGYAEGRLHRTSGMILKPSFYARTGVARDAALRTLGLEPHLPTGIVMFGGHGSMEMLKIADALHDRQLILLCGHNERLAQHLRSRSPARPHAVVGFTRDVAACMAAADYFIGKPGPGSLAEAIHMQLPVLTFRNAWTMPQERYNAQWVREQGVGVVATSMASVRRACDELLRRRHEFQARLRGIDNRAVFEIPDILSQLLHEAVQPRRSALPQVHVAEVPA